jgi:hypothetical protein
MKYQPSSLRHAFKPVFLLVSFSAVLISINQGLSNARAQDADKSPLTLVVRENGFDGLYVLDGKTYKIENWVSKEMFRTRILRPDGGVLIETSKESEAVLILLPTGKLEIDVPKPTAFSSEEERAFKQFIQSDDYALVKKIVMEVFKQRKGEKPPLLGGFAVISMFLGE